MRVRVRGRGSNAAISNTHAHVIQRLAAVEASYHKELALEELGGVPVARLRLRAAHVTRLPTHLDLVRASGQGEVTVRAS